MEQVRALKNVLHEGQIRKVGHIFKVPDDMDLETARRLVDKEIVTDSIEVLEEPEAVLAVDVQKDGVEVALEEAAVLEPSDDEGTGEPGEEVTELSDDTPEDDGETDDDSCTNDKCDFYLDGDKCDVPDGPQSCDNRILPPEATSDGEEEQAVDIATLTKKQLKEELKERKLSTSGSRDVLYERLKAVVEVKDAGSGEGEAGEE